jgi:hypothetical protein
MIVYICGGERDYGKKFVDMVENLETNPDATFEDYKKAGFTNFHEPDLYFCKFLTKGKYGSTSFSITINKKTMKISHVDLLDENFLQPCYCNKKFFELSKEQVNYLINKKVLRYKE